MLELKSLGGQAHETHAAMLSSWQIAKDVLRNVGSRTQHQQPCRARVAGAAKRMLAKEAHRAMRTRDHCTQTRIFNLKPCKDRDAKTKELVNTRKQRDEAQAGDSET